MCAADFGWTTTFPCACPLEPKRESTKCVQGIAKSVNSDQTLIHHIFGAFSPELKVCGFLCQQFHYESNEERPAMRQRTLLSFPRFLKINISVPLTADGLPTDYHPYGPILEYETLDLTRLAQLSQSGNSTVLISEKLVIISTTHFSLIFN